MNRDNEPTNPMTAENVEQFNVWIFDSSELVVSVIPSDAPRNCHQTCRCSSMSEIHSTLCGNRSNRRSSHVSTESNNNAT